MEKKNVVMEKPINNYYYSSDFYSEFMPTGFLNEEIIFASEKEAIKYAESNDIPKYFIYDVFRKNIDKYKSIINIQ